MEDDCDGSTIVRRPFVSGLAGNAAVDFAYRWDSEDTAAGIFRSLDDIPWDEPQYW